MTTSPAPPASQQVVVIPELRAMIFGHLDKQGIAKARLVCSVFEAEVSPSLFKTLRVGLRKRYMRRLERVAAIPKFAKGVREVVWETMQYCGQHKGKEIHDLQCVSNLLHQLDIPKEPFWDELEFAAVDSLTNGGKMTADAREWWKRNGAIGLARYRALRRDEEELAADLLRPARLLAKAFKAFSGLQDVTITSWAGEGERKFFDSGSILGHSELMPPPCNNYLDQDMCCKRQNFALREVIGTLLKSERKIRRLAIFPTSRDVLNPLAKEYDVAGMLMEFRGLISNAGVEQQLKKVLSHLKEFELDMSHIDRKRTSILHLVDLVNGCKGLPAFLGVCSRLETLNLNLRAQDVGTVTIKTTVISLDRVFGNTIFSRLRSLTLSDFWLEAAELCNFLHQHAKTLETIKLLNVNLGGSAHLPQQEEGIVRLWRQQWRKYPSFDDRDYSKWKQVAEICRNLPVLQGLSIEGPSVGEDWVSLGVFDAMRSVEYR